MSKLTDSMRQCDPLQSPNVAGVLLDEGAGRIEELERVLTEFTDIAAVRLEVVGHGGMQDRCMFCNGDDWGSRSPIRRSVYGAKRGTFSLLTLPPPCRNIYQ